ncbi:hypothetical protein QT974_09570 [Microcoleus sp. herbarium12]
MLPYWCGFNSHSHSQHTISAIDGPDADGLQRQLSEFGFTGLKVYMDFW